jgi:hypothetical protein
MKIDLRKKVSGLQEEFKKEFGIGIRVYKGSKFAPDVALKELIEPGTKGGKLADNDATLASLLKK